MKQLHALFDDPAPALDKKTNFPVKCKLYQINYLSNNLKHFTNYQHLIFQQFQEYGRYKRYTHPEFINEIEVLEQQVQTGACKQITLGGGGLDKISIWGRRENIIFGHITKNSTTRHEKRTFLFPHTPQRSWCFLDIESKIYVGNPDSRNHYFAGPLANHRTTYKRL